MYCDYISILEGYVESWDHGSGGYITQHIGGYVNYSFLGNWTKIQISNNNTNEYKYYTVIWSKDGSGSSNEDIGMFAIKSQFFLTRLLIPNPSLPIINAIEVL